MLHRGKYAQSAPWLVRCRPNLRSPSNGSCPARDPRSCEPRWSWFCSGRRQPMYNTPFRIVTLAASVAAATLLTIGPGALAGGRGGPGIVRASPPPTAQLGMRASQWTPQPRYQDNTSASRLRPGTNTVITIADYDFMADCCRAAVRTPGTASPHRGVG